MAQGYSCIAEKRCIETIQDGAPKTEFMQFGDTIRIEMKGKDGRASSVPSTRTLRRPAAAG
jgi:fumarylacetoacetate (FAA) hydrolase